MMGILMILGRVAIGMLVCVGIIVVSCLYVAGQADKEELDHPEFIELDGRK